MNQPFSSETRQYFQIKSADDNAAQIILGDGRECFFKIDRLGRYINDKKLVIYTNEMSYEGKQTEVDELNNKISSTLSQYAEWNEKQIELDELNNKTANKKEIISKLKDVGILKGKTLWLRHSYLDKIKSLEKINILDVDYDNDSIILNIKYLDSEFNINFPEDISSVKNYFYTFNPIDKWSNSIVNAINNHKILLGMTNDQIVSSWGYPDKINNSVGDWGVHEQWIYGRSYLYLENGTLKSWQD